MNGVRKDTVTLYIPDGENTQGYVRYVLKKVMRRYSTGSGNSGSGNNGEAPDHGMVVYAFDTDQGDLSFLKRQEALEGYCISGGTAPDTDTPWAIEGIYRIQSIRRYDTGSRWMAHWKLTCR